MNPAASPLRRGSLAIAIGLMVIGSVDPRLMVDRAGHPDLLLACALFWAMTAGFVRGVGFIPARSLPRRLFSTPACALALGLALLRIAMR